MEIENRSLEIRKKVLRLSASAFLPVLVLALIGIMFGQFPFGDNTLLVWDMNWQYASFFSYLHEVLHGNASAFYSFSRAIGDNMMALMGYYLMSPFNLIFYFFDAEHIYIGILLLLLLKVGCSGVTMYLFLERNGRSGCALVFSTAYALSAYVIGYWFNVMWLDALVFLPLMVWGIERLVEKRACMLYIVALACSIITNFYIAYMVCVFSVIYFVCYFFMMTQTKKEYRTLLYYAGSSLLGGMLSAVVTLPVFLSMQEGRAGFSSFSVLKDFSRMSDMRQLLYNLFAGAMSSHPISLGRPLMYCGLLTLLFVMYWFLKKGAAARGRKLAYALMLLFFVASFWLRNLYVAWHGFQVPNGSPYRFSFLFIFLMVSVAHQGCADFLREKSSAKPEVWLCASGVIVLLALLVEYAAFSEEQRKKIWLVNVGLVIVYVLFTAFLKRKKQNCLSYLLPCVMCAELLLNAYCSYAGTEEYTSVSAEVYQDYLERVQPLVEETRGTDEFFRTVMTGEAYRSVNDPMMLAVYGLDSYSSVEDKRVVQIAKNLGYSHSVVFGIHYEDGATMASDALLGIKYIISSESPGEGYTLTDTANGLGLYENQNALPLVFGAGEEILSVQNVDAEHSVFAYLNEFYHSLVREQEDDIFCEAEQKLVTVSECERQEDGTFAASDGAAEAYVEYEVHARAAGSVYIQYSDAGAAAVSAYINGQEMDLGDVSGYVKKLGTLGKDDVALLRFTLAEGTAFCPEKVYVYSEQADVLAQYTAAVSGQAAVSMDTDARIRIQCVSEEAQYMVCTIPYDEGWHVKVDGRKTEAVETDSNLMAIYVEGGEHEIELSYIPRGLYIGGGVSAAAVLICVLYCVGKRKKEKEFMAQ